MIQVESVGEPTLKGFHRPVRAYNVISAAAPADSARAAS